MQKTLSLLPAFLRSTRWPQALLLLVLLSLLSACGGRKLIRDLPPVVRLSQIELQADGSALQIRLENPNDIPFQAEHMQFALAFDGGGLENEVTFDFDGGADVDIVPQSAEEVVLNVRLPAELRSAIEAMDAKASMNWAIRGVVPQLDAREWPFRARGVLYPVPGVAMVYRASATGSAYPIQRSR